jgi:hypothetical protein
MATMYRIGIIEGGAEVAFSQPAHYRRDMPASAQPRVVAGVPGSDPSLLLALAAKLEAPLFMLYVLHTTRGEGGKRPLPERRTDP